MGQLVCIIFINTVEGHFVIVGETTVICISIWLELRHAKTA